MTQYTNKKLAEIAAEITKENPVVAVAILTAIASQSDGSELEFVMMVKMFAEIKVKNNRKMKSKLH